MKFNKKMRFNIFIFLCSSIYLLAAPGAAAPAEFGAILIAHGTMHSAWNDEISRLCSEIDTEMTSIPVEVAFLRFGKQNKKTLKDAIKELKKNNNDLKEVLLVHLSPSSYSIRHEKIKPTAEGIETGLDFMLAPAMDDHPLAAAILKDHAEELSLSPENESLILLGYGPAEELDNIVWIRKLERIGEEIRTKLGFKEVECITLRNHSADLIRSQAITDLQRTAERLSKQGRVIVVPYVLYILPNGSFERELKSYLRGIIVSEDIYTKGVLSHKNTKAWVKKIISDVKNGEELPSVRPVNRNWSAMDREVGGNFKYKYGRVKIEVSED